MTWTAPMTAVAGAIFTAAEFNTHVRDNLLETAPAKATAASEWFVATGLNAVASRQIDWDFVSTGQTTTSTSYTDLITVGAQVTVPTGTRAQVLVSCGISNTVAGAQSRVSVAVTGATTIAANDQWSITQEGLTASAVTRYGITHVFDTLTAGSNTFTMKYRVAAGTGVFSNRELIVMPL